MLKNYFITAYRNLRRNKIFSLINILGLSIGISAALVIFLIVYYEFSYDRFEPGRDLIYRVVLDAEFGGVPGHSGAVPAPLGAAIQKEVTGIDLTVPVFQFQGDATAKVSVAQEDTAKPAVFKNQKDIVFTNQQYFQLLSYQWIAGSAEASLQNPFSVVLTESRARQYFPAVALNAVIGKELTYNGDLRAHVSGIVKDLHQQTLFTAAEFISLPTITSTNLQNRFMMTVWNDWMAYSQLFIKLAPGSNREATELQVKELYKKYNQSQQKGNTITFRLQPLQDTHFNKDYQGFGQRMGYRSTLYGLLAVAAFLLLLGCINFINLSTAQAAQRAREIGIRKTVGSSKTQLVKQFLSETFFITAIAALVSLLFTPLLLHVFADFIPPGLHLDLLHQPYIIIFLLLLTIVVSFLSGIYPALVLSGYNPVRVLKNQAFVTMGTSRYTWIRKSLTISQFVIAQFFITGTLLVSKQINYSLNADMGFRKEAILNFDIPFDTTDIHGAQLLNKINTIPEVEIASTGFFSPASWGVAFTNVQYKEKPDLKANVQLRWGDSNYMKVYQLNLLAGRNIQGTGRFKEFLINETYAKLLGFQRPEDALNKSLVFNGNNMPIVGVMKDFHTQSLHSAIDPIVFAGGSGFTFHIRLKPNDPGSRSWQSAIGKIQKAYRQVYPDGSFSYVFLDDAIARFYVTEQNMSRLLLWATGLMVLISCLGLLGLVIYTTNRRTKEIGLRRILGASVTNIVSILSKDFLQLVFIAFLIAAPIAWWAAYKWLQDYTYRTSISWWVFGLTAVIIALFALLTLGVQTIRAAIANPVKNLRVE